MVNLVDTMVLDGVRRTKDGYLAAFANVARTGIQKYRGSELGRPDLGEVMVYRPAEEVFHKDALKSMAHRPVTLLHPKEVVDAKNWKKYAKGHTGDEVVRDGDHVRVPMVLMDAEAIAAVEKGGTRELSMGYSTDLKFEPGITEDGQHYDAVQTEIRANHLAIVPAARGGSKLRFGDAEQSTSSMKGTTKMSKIIMIDAAPVEVADELAAAVVTNKIKALTDAVSAAEEDAAKKKKEAMESKAACDAAAGEIAVLKQQVADAAITPDKLDVLVKERSEVIDAASSLLDKAFVFSGKHLIDIRRAAVSVKLGDSVAKDMSDAGIEGAFKALTVGAPKIGTKALVDTFNRSVPAGHTVIDGDVRDVAFAENQKYYTNAWRGKAVQ